MQDAEGWLLTVRKSGTAIFMLPGGKREPGEDDLTALTREVAEEIGCRVTGASLLGVFEAEAANESGRRVRSCAYLTELDGEPAAMAEIEDLRWIDPTARDGPPLAPLLTDHILPKLAVQARSISK